jgi:hypothetical protein
VVLPLGVVRLPVQVPVAVTAFRTDEGTRVTAELNDETPANWHCPANVSPRGAVPAANDDAAKHPAAIDIATAATATAVRRLI